MKTKNIFTLSVSKKLYDRGHFLVKKMPNFKHPGLMVYVFVETPELIEDLVEITKKR